MSIELNNFVKIQLNYHESAVISGSRKAVVLLDTSTSTSALVSGKYYVDSESKLPSYAKTSDRVFVKDVAWGDSDPNKIAFESFFANGGLCLHYVKAAADSDDGALAAVEALPYQEIVVCLAPSWGVTATAAIAEIEAEKLTGVYEKIVIANHKYKTSAVCDCAAYKYDCGKEYGYETTIGAYLSKIDVYRDEIQDYAFTKEAISKADAILDNDDTAKTLIAGHANFDGYVAGAIRNIGGDMSNGRSLVNQFVKIVLCQTLSERLVALLASKIKYNQNGINMIANCICKELNKYVSNGYLTTEKVWADQDLVYQYGGYRCVLIKEGEPLSQGYKFIIPPLDSMSIEDKAAHKLPTITLLLADCYSVRAIEINGEIF